MSRTDSTAKKFNTNLPSWLAAKLLAKQDEQTRPLKRTTQKLLWRKEEKA